MKSGKCPKCGSTEVYLKKDGFQRSLTVVLGFGDMRMARFEDYLCMNCGFTESYITNLNDMKDVPDKWTKAGE